MSHYEERLGADLLRIRQRLRQMGDGVQEALRNAARCVQTRNADVAAEVILGDVPINRRYRDLDHRCHVFVAQHLPSARHLRFVSAVLRLSKTLERIGDYAETISRAALQLSDRPPERIGQDIEMMAQHSQKILEQSLKAFDEENSELARGTLAVAGQYGTTFDKVFEDLTREGEQRSRPITDLFSLMAIFNRFERVIHQAKNICEQTIFVDTGETKHDKEIELLFVGRDNTGPSLLAEAIAKKAYAEVGMFQSAGWEAGSDLDPAYLTFMEEKGLNTDAARPLEFAAMADKLQDFDIVVDLTGKADKHIPKVPFHTTLISWPLESRDDPQAVYEQLAPRLNRLMGRLRGNGDD